MESQYYKTFTSEFKWISKWETWPLQIRLNPQFWFFAHLSDHRLSLFCSAINEFMIGYFFLSLFITFRTNVWMSVIPSPCWFLFALHLKWSLNISIDQKSNAICIFENLRSTLFSLWFKFSSAWFYFLLKSTKS